MGKGVHRSIHLISIKHLLFSSGFQKHCCSLGASGVENGKICIQQHSACMWVCTCMNHVCAQMHLCTFNVGSLPPNDWKMPWRREEEWLICHTKDSLAFSPSHDWRVPSWMVAVLGVLVQKQTFSKWICVSLDCTQVRQRALFQCKSAEWVFLKHR